MSVTLPSDHMNVNVLLAVIPTGIRFVDLQPSLHCKAAISLHLESVKVHLSPDNLIQKIKLNRILKRKISSNYPGRDVQFLGKREYWL